MALKQIGTSNIKFSAIGGNAHVPVSSDISLAAIKIAYAGSSTAYSDLGTSRSSLWNLATCRSSISPDSVTPYIPGTTPLNPTNDKTSAGYTGWVYAGSSSPWNPASVKEFTRAANTRPKAIITKVGLGTPGVKDKDITNYFKLQIQGGWIDDNGSAVTPTAPNGATTGVFFFWILGPDPAFAVGKWTLAPGGYCEFAKVYKGTYTVFVQDEWGAGNQFDVSYSSTYPPT